MILSARGEARGDQRLSETAEKAAPCTTTSPHWQGGMWREWRDVEEGGREGVLMVGGWVGGWIISKGQCEYSDCSQLDKTVS